LRLWDLESGECLRVLEGHEEWVRGAVLTHDGKVLSWSEDNTLRLWDIESGKCLRVFEGHEQPVRDVTLMPGFVFSLGDDWTIRLWNLGSGECLHVAHLASEGSSPLVYSLSENRLVCGTQNGQMIIFSPENVHFSDPMK
ncbi:WD40 repeat domain-containing protein, partial [Aminivibrio sp.]|uniref:WD40 repeat domain-containing protein n=1 Tax=Aminivibrio sp. TaxID=1872489 RepID=UPI00345E9E21